ncbi:YopX family protein [Listeria ivanovii]|uniref:YopX family protein n=1 Tax=Listeria ivanovii TaxID=1638 RepID=UPI003CF05486
MRQIEFRAKALGTISQLDEAGLHHENGWVTGNLLDNEYIINGVIDSNDEYIAIESWCQIDKNTVGQFTGLTDKNGKKIFEGDICWDEHNECCGVVVYEEGKFLYVWENIATDLCEINRDIVIAGDIFNNPELLEVTE